MRERIEALAPAILPKGVGAYSAAVLQYEMKGFERFKNRRQVASYTGLCPGIHLSDGRGKEGSIKRIKDGKEHRYWSVVSLSSGTTYQLSPKAFESELKHRSVVQTF